MRLHFQQELENNFKFRAEGDFELLSLTLGGDVGNERAAGDNEGQVPITHTNRLSDQTEGDRDRDRPQLNKLTIRSPACLIYSLSFKKDLPGFLVKKRQIMGRNREITKRTKTVHRASKPSNPGESLSYPSILPHLKLQKLGNVTHQY